MTADDVACFEPTEASLVEVLMSSGVVTERQAVGIAAITMQLEAARKEGAL